MDFWIILALSSAALYALRDVLAKKIFKGKKLDPLQLVFEQYLVVFLITFLLFAGKINLAVVFESIELLTIKTFLMGTGLFLYYKLIKEHELSMISPIGNLTPALVAVWAYFILSEVLTFTQMTGILLSIMSFFLLELSMHHKHEKKISKTVYKKLKKKNALFYLQVAGMLMTFSFSTIVDRVMFERGMDVFTLLGTTSGALLVGAVFILVKKGELKESFSDLIKKPEMLLLSVAFTAATFVLLYAIMLGDAPVSLIITLRRVSTFITIFFGGILFHEHHLWKKVLATCGMFAGIVMIIF